PGARAARRRRCLPLAAPRPRLRRPSFRSLGRRKRYGDRNSPPRYAGAQGEGENAEGAEDAEDAEIWGGEADSGRGGIARIRTPILCVLCALCVFSVSASEA